MQSMNITLKKNIDNFKITFINFKHKFINSNS